MKSQILKLASLGFVALMVLACKEEKKEAKTATDGFVINGTVKNVDNALLYIYTARGLDSIQVTNGTFTYTGKTDYPDGTTIRFKDSDTFFESFYLENGELSMVIDSSATTDRVKVKGSKTNDEYLRFKEITSDPYTEQYNTLAENIYMKDSLFSETELKTFQKEFDSIYGLMTAAVDKYIADNPNSFVTANVIADRYDAQTDLAVWQKAYDPLGDNIKNSGIGKTMREAMATAKNTAIGAIAPDISAASPEGKTIALSETRGQYVLLDYWASWCGPCKIEYPFLRKAYKKYHDKGFEIYAVSLDDSKEDWVNAITENEFTWPQVCDFKVTEGPAVATYGITGIPSNFLLDKEGKIMAKDLRGEELLNKLEELL